ncbi:type II secretion system protein GspK [Rhizobium sp. Nf11,1]|uniref:helix-hairpin-helix domain-containing protein n=1 Tax=unclassified Rhizobium TaxID=2613769 RepID=UPI003D3309D4
MGFYAVAQIVSGARNHGVEIRTMCINRSRWDCTLEPIEGTDRHAVRLGMHLVRGLATADAARIVAARADQPFDSVDDMWRRSGVPAASLVELAEADAFLPFLGLQRRDSLWGDQGPARRAAALVCRSLRAREQVDRGAAGTGY